MRPSAAFRLHAGIETPLPLHSTTRVVTLQGWCLAENLPDPPAVRVVTGDGILPLIARTASSGAAKLHSSHPAAAHAGFVVGGPLATGLHVASFEAQRPDGDWQCFGLFTLTVSPPPLHAMLDEPVAAGVIRERIEIGGWALGTDDPVDEITVHYGHRELTCDTGHPRGDVAGLFPGVPGARRAGFRTRGNLVAGHGPVRIKARLASGRLAFAPTQVVVSVASDENHPAELDLAAPRVGLEQAGAARPAAPGAPVRASRPLRVLFVLHGSFASNSSHHVAALANELAAAGHTCVVAVPRDLSTLAHHDRPAFRGLTFADAERGLAFPDGQGPDFIHAWTPRENVRRLTESLRARHRARVIIHLEDNEAQLLAAALGRDYGVLDAMGDAELDRLVPATLTHPHRGRAFLQSADGVTFITERLAAFVPAGTPGALLWPAADARHFYPRPRPDAFRRVLDVAPNETVLFYHGNVHAANVAEVGELYAAVLALNRGGDPVTLIRTGLDRAEMDAALAAAVAPFVFNLGLIPHHRHLPALMALADIFVQPGEPGAFNDFRFPSKLPEFFSLGRPVVLPRTNLGTKVRHGIDAYVLARADAAGIAAAVRELRADRALAGRLGRGAAAFAETHFSWRRSGAALASFYQSFAPL
jgi:glycosyltransferase involved in cell wall biosynthesis